MNKIKVGMASSPNLKVVRSKVGSLQNANYRPGGGAVKIESRKLEWKSEAKTKALNEGYSPKGGDKKVIFRPDNCFGRCINHNTDNLVFFVDCALCTVL
jgi:hypothetical protein